MHQISDISKHLRRNTRQVLAVHPRQNHQFVPYILLIVQCLPCHLDPQARYVPSIHQTQWHLYISLTRINYTSIAADQPQTAALAQRRSSANRSRTSRSARPWWTTTATEHALLYHLASTQTQAFRPIHRQHEQRRRQTAKHTRPQHQVQAAPGATAMKSLPKSHRKSLSTVSAPSHNRIPNANSHASILHHPPPPHHLDRQISPPLFPSAKWATTTKRQQRRLSWRRGHATSSFRLRWELHGRVLLLHIRHICLSRHLRL